MFKDLRVFPEKDTMGLHGRARDVLLEPAQPDPSWVADLLADTIRRMKEDEEIHEPPMAEIQTVEIEEGYEVIEVIYRRSTLGEDSVWTMETQRTIQVPRSATKRIATLLQASDTFWQDNHTYSTDADPDSQRRVELETFLSGLARSVAHRFVAAGMVESLDEPVERIHVFYPRKDTGHVARMKEGAKALLGALDDLSDDD